VAVAAAVLLLHAAVLGLLPMAPGPGWQGETLKPLQVRQIVRAASLAPEAAEASVAKPALPQPPKRAPAAATADRTAVPANAVAPQAAPSAEIPENAPPPVAEAEPGGAAVPVYATRLPPAQTLTYALRRGQQQGRAVLRWEREGDAFSLSLKNDWRGAQATPGLGSASRGHVTSTGLAPERHTESRRGRDVRAVNFQYDSARITFSGPSVEYPLLAGSQDRLTWMLQLAGVVEANPALRLAGSEIAMFVVGSRGDGEVWTFTVQGSEDLEAPAGTVQQALHLTREARRPYDTKAEVWLDPARNFLPARVRLLVRPTGEGTDFLLESVTTP
jgi:hypothetical protein